MKQLVAGDLMSHDVIAVDPDMTVQELAAFLTDRQITGAPVIALYDDGDDAVKAPLRRSPARPT